MMRIYCPASDSPRFMRGVQLPPFQQMLRLRMVPVMDATRKAWRVASVEEAAVFSAIEQLWDGLKK